MKEQDLKLKHTPNPNRPRLNVHARKASPTGLTDGYVDAIIADIEELKTQPAVVPRDVQERVNTILDKLEDRVKEVLGAAKQKVTEVRRKVITGDKSKRVRDYVKEPPVVKLKDKISFTLGVSLILLTEYFILLHPDVFHLYFMAVMVPLLIARFYLYITNQLGYFLYDFCYFVNACCFVSILYPEWTLLNNFCFVMTNGPLVWAILTWRNSLVFHSLDKVTSVYIHVLPSLLMYCRRWYKRDGAAPLEDRWLSFDQHILFPILGYLLWQVAYVYRTEILDKERLKHNKDLQTSMRWLTGHKGRNSALTILTLRVCRGINVMRSDENFDSDTWKTKIIFMTVQLIYTIFTIAPVIVYYKYKAVHTCFLVFIYLSSMWNGASFYIDVFSRKYMQQVVQASNSPTDISSGSEGKGD